MLPGSVFLSANSFSKRFGRDNRCSISMIRPFPTRASLIIDSEFTARFIERDISNARFTCTFFRYDRNTLYDGVVIQSTRTLISSSESISSFSLDGFDFVKSSLMYLVYWFINGILPAPPIPGIAPGVRNGDISEGCPPMPVGGIGGPPCGIGGP